MPRTLQKRALRDQASVMANEQGLGGSWHPLVEMRDEWGSLFGGSARVRGALLAIDLVVLCGDDLPLTVAL